MNKYIDADMLIKKYIDTDIKKFSNSDVKIVLENLKQNILKAPTIDLVICAECKFKRLYDDGETKYYYCALEDRPNRQWSVDDWNYCYWGERMESE